MRFPGRRAIVAIALVAGLAAPALTATAASASATDHGKLRPEFFTIAVSTVNPAGTVNAFGPVHGTDGTLTQVSNSLDIFVFDRGTVNVAHEATTNNMPVIDPQSCRFTFTEQGTWQFQGGTMAYRHAFGFGHYFLFEKGKLQRKHHHDGQCDTQSAPRFFSLQVFASGLASNRHDHM